MSTPRLPVPPLADTMARYLQWVQPLLNETQFTQTQAVAAQFIEHEGGALQAALQQFATARDDSSWLIEAWLDAYLSCRAPLPLVSNVGFAIPTEPSLHGIDGLARWLAAAAAIHADYLQGRIAADISPQGQPVCMRQWQILQGGMRTAGREVDGYQMGEAVAENRYIGVWHRGYYYRMLATDAQGEAYGTAAFRAALTQIYQSSEVNPYPVATPAFLGSEAGAAVMVELAHVAANTELLAAIQADLFHVSLHHQPGLSADEDLRDGTFNAQSEFWPYKTLTYRFNLATNRLMLHVEHTWPDGGMLSGMVGLIQHHLATTLDSDATDTVLPITRYAWTLTAAQQQQWPVWQQRYADQADSMRVSSSEVRLAAVPKGFSQDALIQFALQYAQLRVYGRIRNTYEAVDVSHFQCGRTECIRPVSNESVTLVRAMQTGSATTEQLMAALAEHKNRVKACKTGQGVNRHLLGLKLMAERNGSEVALFSDAAYHIINTDFLSTSTLGYGEVIRNFAFAPTSADGLGVNYTLLPSGWLLTLSHTATQAEAVQQFQVAFAEAAAQLLDLTLAAAA